MISLEVVQESVCPKYTIDPAQFQTDPTCPICLTKNNVVLVSQLKDSLEYSFCLDCSHMYASSRPTQKWYVETYYPAVWDKKWRMTPIKGVPVLRSIRRRATEV